MKLGEQWQVPFCRVSNCGQDCVDGAALGCWVCSLDGDWLGADPLDAGASLGGDSVSGASLDANSLTGGTISLKAGGVSLDDNSLDSGISLSADSLTGGGISLKAGGVSLDAAEVPFAGDSLGGISLGEAPLDPA